MEIWLKIETDNAAFADDGRAEIVRILEKLSSGIENGLPLQNGLNAKIKDINGEPCGYLAVYDEPRMLIKVEDFVK